MAVWGQPISRSSDWLSAANRSMAEAGDAARSRAQLANTLSANLSNIGKTVGDYYKTKRATELEDEELRKKQLLFDQAQEDRTSLQQYAGGVAEEPKARAFLTEAAGNQPRYDEMSYSGREQELLRGVDPTSIDAYSELLRRRGATPEELDSIRDKTSMQLGLSNVADTAKPQYETRAEMSTRVLGDMRKQGIPVSTDVLDRHKDVLAAETLARSEKAKNLRATLGKKADKLKDIELDIAKEEDKLRSSGKSSSFYLKPSETLNRKLSALKSEVSPFGVGFDASNIENAVSRMRGLGWSDDKIAFVIDSGIDPGINNSFPSGREQQDLISDYGKAYDSRFGAKSDKGYNTLRNLREQAGELSSEIGSSSSRLESAMRSPEESRDRYAESLLSGMPRGQSTRIRRAPREETSRPTTPPREEALGLETTSNLGRTRVDRNIGGIEEEEEETGGEETVDSRLAFNRLLNKPNKTPVEIDRMSELANELGIELPKGRVRDVGSIDPSTLKRDRTPMEGLREGLSRLFPSRREGLETGPTLEENRRAIEEAEINRLINNVQGKRTGLLSYPSQQEIQEARKALREIYLMNPTAFVEKYGSDILTAIYR